MVNPAKNRGEETTLTAQYSQGPPPDVAGVTGPPNINDLSRDDLRRLLEGIAGYIPAAQNIYDARSESPGGKFNSLLHMMVRVRPKFSNSAQFTGVIWPAIQTKFFNNEFRIA